MELRNGSHVYGVNGLARVETNGDLVPGAHVQTACKLRYQFRIHVVPSSQ